MDWLKGRYSNVQDSKWGDSVDTFEEHEELITNEVQEGSRKKRVDGRNHESTIDPKSEHSVVVTSVDSFTNCEQEITEVDTCNDKLKDLEISTYSEGDFEDVESDNAAAPNDRQSSKEEHKGHRRIISHDNVTFGNTDANPHVSRRDSNIQGAASNISEIKTARSEMVNEEPVGFLGTSVDGVVVQPCRAEDGAGDVIDVAGGNVCDPRKLKARNQFHLMNKLSIDQCDLKDKRVLIRVDYDIPLIRGAISDTSRISISLPTIVYALCRGARSVVLMSHLGRPGGRVQKSLSLRPMAEELEKQLKKPVTFLEDCVGQKVEAVCADPPRGSVILLENLRFHVEEEGQGFDESGQQVLATQQQLKQFRTSMTKLGDIYVNDAFTTLHRTHSSVIGCAMKQRACGLMMKMELDCYSKLMCNSRKPFLAIVGGAKFSDKFQLIENLLNHVTEIIIAGEIAFTFLKIVLNVEIGDTLFDDKGSHVVLEIMERANRNGVVVHLPIDFLAADRYAEGANIQKCNRMEGIPAGMIGVDVGDQTNKHFAQIIFRANTIVWSGAPGVFEWEDFSHGTREMMDAIVQATERGVTTVLVGGDTATCAMKFGAQELVTHLSTGGGAILEILEGKILPGISVLSRAAPKANWTD